MFRRRPTGLVVFVALATVILAGRPSAAPAPVTDRTAVMLGGLSDADLIVVTTALAGSRHPGVVLLDSPRAEAVVKPFLTRFQPDRVVAIGEFPGGVDAVERRWGVPRASVAGVAEEPVDHARSLVRGTDTVVVAPPVPLGQLLQAACLAGTLPAPLFVTRDFAGLPPELTAYLKDHKPAEVIAVGAAATAVRTLSGVRVTELADTAAVARAHRQRLRADGPIQTLVLANPADARLSALAPWVAVQRRAALLLTGPDGTDAGAIVRQALAADDTAAAENLLVLADPRTVPTERRPNPAAGKDTVIEMEPGTPPAGEAFTLAIGRVFHPDRAIVPLVLARPRLAAAAPKALIASNPGGSLPLLETFSRVTARELANAGYAVTPKFGREVKATELRQMLPANDLFLWEGHYKTLVEKYGFSTWDEPLPPSVVVLQSCLALNETEAVPLFNRGSVAVVGSLARTYAASGGAFTLAFFDGLAYEDQTLGSAARQGKNFLQCYARLKQKRLNGGAKLDGANVRASWAFTVWGDPAMKPPHPSPPADALPALRHAVNGDAITITVPARSYDTIDRPPYRAKAWPNGRMAGLLTSADEDDRRLVPFAFAEVHLPGGPAGAVPRLTSRVPDNRWVFQWDGRRRRGYLLVQPREKDAPELRFRVSWTSPERPDAGRPDGRLE